MTEAVPAAPAQLGEVVLRRRGEGVATWAMGSLFEQLVSDRETGGRFGVSAVTQPAGIAPPLHVHTHEAECFVLLEGGMTYRAGDEVTELGAGDAVHLPAGVPHAFRVGPSGVRYLALTAPGRLMNLYDEVGARATERRVPVPGVDGFTMTEEIARWNEIAPRYGLVVVGPPIPAS
jgi:quercetin dioxygenase-like cupin family protein